MLMDEETALDWLKGTLKGELSKRSLTYADLLERLHAIGVEETEGGLRNKLSRGTFSALYLCQCLEAIGVKSFKIDLVDFVESRAPRKYGVVTIDRETKRQVVLLRWTHNRPPTGTIVLLPGDYPEHSGPYSIVCGNCDAHFFIGWSLEEVCASFAGTDKVARCTLCGAYNELPGSDVTVEMGPVRAE
jgi:hypothetical protein